MVVGLWHDSLPCAWGTWGTIWLLASGSKRVVTVYIDQSKYSVIVGLLVDWRSPPPKKRCATGGRDRTAARTTLGGEFPALALSIGKVGASFHPGPRFRRPPCDPGRWDFPSPVLTLASLRSPFHTVRSFSADPPTPRHFMVCFPGRSLVHR